MQTTSTNALPQPPRLDAPTEDARFATQGSINADSRVRPLQQTIESEIVNYDPESYEKLPFKRKFSDTNPQEGINFGSSPSSVRRRISRACDQCNQLRTKCNGGLPCERCKESNFDCKYARQHKKRGRAPGKNYSQSIVSGSGNVGVDAALSPSSYKSPNSPSSEAEHSHFDPVRNRPTSASNLRSTLDTGLQSFTSAPQNLSNRQNYISRSTSLSETPASTSARQRFMYEFSRPRSPLREDPRMIDMSRPNSIDDVEHNTMHANDLASNSDINPHVAQNYRLPQHVPGAQQAYEFADTRLGSRHPWVHAGSTAPGQAFSGNGPSLAFVGQAPAAPSPPWGNLPSPPSMDQGTVPSSRSADFLRYPVLRPLVPLIESIVPRSLACDLLDVYFTSSSLAQLRPSSPHILGYVFRKKSFLHPTNPRRSSPALLASMLWIAAQTSNSSFLSSHPAARGRVCRRLLELTVDLLKPLIHSPVPGGTSLHGPTNHIIDDVSLGVLGMSTDHVGFEGSVTAQVDVLATYIHLATVVSASERKAASLRWWNAAWSIARELKFGREAPPSPPSNELGDFQGETGFPTSDLEGDTRSTHQGVAQTIKGFNADPRRTPGFMTEEEREERRRIWWLLYMMDRHLALCYNRPISLLDKECDGLLQPMDDNIWQSGQFASSESTYPFRRCGPSIECTGQSIFGYFLPLMTILGSIVDLNHSRSRPTFGTGFHHPNKWDDYVQEITHQLELYGQSLQDLETKASLTVVDQSLDNRYNEAATPSVRSSSTNDSQMMNESIVQRKTVISYGTHIMHVLHILLAGKWDPITLLDDNDLWISTPSFITATDHAIAAAEAVSGIIEYDPDLSFMPFFFGVYLLQGSFLLLLFADKLQGDVSPNVVKACETVIRAHEACVVTLDTQYQRNFRKVMRSALAQVRGRMAEDLAEQQHWRREVLSLYRWTGDGTGLAL